MRSLLQDVTKPPDATWMEKFDTFCTCSGRLHICICSGTWASWTPSILSHTPSQRSYVQRFRPIALLAAFNERFLRMLQDPTIVAVRRSRQGFLSICFLLWCNRHRKHRKPSLPKKRRNKRTADLCQSQRLYPKRPTTADWPR